MDPLSSATLGAQDDPDVVLRSLGREGERGRRLRAQLAGRFPGRPDEEIEDAVQSACRSFLAEAEGISEPGRIYAWIRTAAHHALLREIEHHGRERATDPVELGRADSLVEKSGPADELISIEEDMELGALVGEVADSLTGRRRDVLALWGAGHARPEIAARLGVSERVVKRDLLAIMDEARLVLAREAGGGCLEGEPLVLRLTYGLASAGEAAQARLHLDRCPRCSGLAGRLEAWREKAGALLPGLPAVEATDPGTLARAANRAGHTLGSLRRHILGGGAQVKQQAAAAAAHSPNVDPTPLAGSRPGTAAAIVASCLAIGGGAAGYCAQQGVDPLGAAGDLIGVGGEGEPTPAAPAPEPSEPLPAATTPAEEAPVYEPAPAPEEVESAPAPEAEPEAATEQEPEPEPEPAPEPEPTPPEATFEPSAPVTSPPSEEVVAEPATESTPAVKAKPAPVPSGDAPQFGGP
jgi:RNA polymerase sigma factor (sigma-70 family)